MNDSDIQSYQYQFSGYDLPKVQLDETGPAYVVIPEPPPYYRDQPSYWGKPAYDGYGGVMTRQEDSYLVEKPLYPLVPFQQDPPF